MMMRRRKESVNGDISLAYQIMITIGRLSTHTPEPTTTKMKKASTYGLTAGSSSTTYGA